MFIIIDGIDGSGKGTIVDAWIDHLEQNGKTIFNLKKYWKTHQNYPSIEVVGDRDVLISCEPTFAWIGSTIRKELISEGTDYSTNSIAQAYALDRLILYKKTILPFLKKGGLVIKDRSVSTSLCYQPLQDGITKEEVSKIEGNAFALDNPPDYLVIANLPSEMALNRLIGRTEKKDDSIFEKKDFLEKARQTFLSKNYQNYFTSRGTKIKILDSSQNIDIMNQDAVNLLKNIILT